MKLKQTVLSLGVALATSAALAEAPAELYLKLCNATQTVRAHAPDGRMFFGTGVMVGTNRAVTNCHVVRDASSVSLGRGSFATPVESLADDTARDLCIVSVPSSPGDAQTVRSAKTLAIGETVYAAGYSGGMRASVSEGKVVALHPHANGFVIQTSAPFGLGASGGGLFDSQGRLVGVLTFFGRSGQTDAFYAIPVDWIDEVEANGFHAVAPLKGERAFWATSEDALPAFLKRNPSNAVQGASANYAPR